MRKGERKYWVLLGIVFLLAVALEILRPEPIDWTTSLEHDDSRPYGSLILYDVLPDLFPGAAVRVVDLPPYMLLQDTLQTPVNYVFLTDRFAPDPEEAGALLDFVARGNVVFVSAWSMGGLLADTLNVRTAFDVKMPAVPGADVESDSFRVTFVNPKLEAPHTFFFDETMASSYFGDFDTLRTTVLTVNADSMANYICVDVGDGALYLNTLPLAFTNYVLLREDQAGYVYRALSYLPVRDVWWDAYVKPGRDAVRTPLRYILREPSLRSAYIVVLALVLLFVLSEGRRRQRVIPVIEPPRNATLDFVRTIGRLYYQRGDHANLAEKKITYFLDYIRTHLRLPTNRIDDSFLARVADRSGVPMEDVRAVFNRIGEVQRQKKIGEAELIRLSESIEAFYRKSKR